jgi:hypothetical protein
MGYGPLKIFIDKPHKVHLPVPQDVLLHFVTSIVIQARVPVLATLKMTMMMHHKTFLLVEREGQSSQYIASSTL